ncbi:flavin-containing monooxygenase [Burkholderia ubonensis]|uniref:FAD-containing monooxygenase EthA n=1 Tax=Burkholderia ubonensis subsp. mesacidophila TaxID=265293 RepID=A0A2A4FG98_9BURK|nr:NAD(P)/FAD-dependent oxidoreductase [Burkholderia ubonensis]PCE32431.1 FAD-containing monooxygenase EthA [Burkholderia ubonensis subsp. mesacidophila]
MKTDYDVLIIGAGISGIGMACHLARACPDKRVAILERRNAIGGTWDLFRYPGIRSDSDMFSFGYAFRPWHDYKVLADGPSIRQYIADTAREHGVDRFIHFGVKIDDARWSTEQRRWTVSARHEDSGDTSTFTCNYLVPCTGYYNHDRGYLPHFPGQERFTGLRIHPQHWPEELDYRGKRVVVIGSGATAVTLVPAMAGRAAHVTMLQRSPSYIFSVPAYDKISAVLDRVLPTRWVYGMARWRNIRLQRFIYKAAKRWPRRIRSWLLAHVEKQVGDGVDMRHFTPGYNPWDERLCAVPDGDLFKVIRAGKASVVTDHIETFTENGILLKSGKVLHADIIVTATGLQLQSLGGMKLHVDGRQLDISALMTYKGVLLQDVPNFAYLFGYTNAPWTLKVDMAATYVCRLMKHMDAEGFDMVTAHAPSGEMLDESILGSLQSGYVQRGQGVLPRQGQALPWRVLHNLEADREMLLKETIADPVLEFRRPGSGVPASPARRADKRTVSA